MIRHPPRSTLFPSPPLSRSLWADHRSDDSRIEGKPVAREKRWSDKKRSNPFPAERTRSVRIAEHLGCCSHVADQRKSERRRPEDRKSTRLELQSQSNLVCRL